MDILDITEIVLVGFMLLAIIGAIADQYDKYERRHQSSCDKR